MNRITVVNEVLDANKNIFTSNKNCVLCIHRKGWFAVESSVIVEMGDSGETTIWLWAK